MSDAGNDYDRGTGRTTAQILGLPKNAHFVWCNEVLHYPRRLCERLRRSDVTVVGPSWVLNGNWMGCELTGVLVDHAYEDRKNESRFWELFNGVKTRIRVNPNRQTD